MEMMVATTCRGTCQRLLTICHRSHRVSPGVSQWTQDEVSNKEERERTPRTMPSGNRMPNASIWRKMWIHRIVSCSTPLAKPLLHTDLAAQPAPLPAPRLFEHTRGSIEIVAPSGISPVSCSWASAEGRLARAPTSRKLLVMAGDLSEWRRSHTAARAVEYIVARGIGVLPRRPGTNVEVRTRPDDGRKSIPWTGKGESTRRPGQTGGSSMR